MFLRKPQMARLSAAVTVRTETTMFFQPNPERSLFLTWKKGSAVFLNYSTNKSQAKNLAYTQNQFTTTSYILFFIRILCISYSFTIFFAVEIQICINFRHFIKYYKQNSTRLQQLQFCQFMNKYLGERGGGI